jgi:hypothetical protein
MLSVVTKILKKLKFIIFAIIALLLSYLDAEPNRCKSIVSVGGNDIPGSCTNVPDPQDPKKFLGSIKTSAKKEDGKCSAAPNNNENDCKGESTSYNVITTVYSALNCSGSGIDTNSTASYTKAVNETCKKP